MLYTDTKEAGFETLIVDWLVQHNGYEEGDNSDYNKEYAVDETRLFRFLQDTQPDQMDKLGVFKSDQKKRQFLNRLQGELAKRGIIDVLRNGIKVYPVDLIMFYLTPTENNLKAKEMWEKNIFSVTRQLRYSIDAARLALDMCVFINGLPVITFELKNQLTKQNTDDAVEQYKTDSVSFAENASFKTYDDSGKEKALGKCVLISADIDNGIFVMLGNIELDLPSDNIKIIAESLKMNKKTEQIVSRSGSSVLLQKDGVEISGKGFCASGASKSYAFMQNVSGSIDTEDR